MSSYRIRDLELLSGVKAHTIRVWEKRYDLFSPSRTKTNIRRYTEDDLRLALNISLLLKLGYRIGQLARLSNDEMHALIREREQYAKNEAIPSSMVDGMLGLDAKLFLSKLNGSIQSDGLSIVYEKIFMPFLQKVGMLWQAGTITPAQEHFASNIIRDIIVEHTQQLPPTNPRRKWVLLFLPEGELHEIPLLYLNYFIQAQGNPTFYLGQSVPTSSIVSADFNPQPGIIVTAISKALPQSSIDNLFKAIAKRFPAALQLVIGYQTTIAPASFPKDIRILESTSQLSSIIK